VHVAALAGEGRISGYGKAQGADGHEACSIHSKCDVAERKSKEYALPEVRAEEGCEEDGQILNKRLVLVAAPAVHEWLHAK
jgi:hypothetical protein